MQNSTMVNQHVTFFVVFDSIQITVTCFKTLPQTAPHCNTHHTILQRTSRHTIRLALERVIHDCSLQCVAVRCSVLQCVSVCCKFFLLLYSPVIFKFSIAVTHNHLFPKSQVISHKRATTYRSLLRKTTYKDKGSYESSPPYILIRYSQVTPHI